jgi:phosphoglucosamine mutase
VELVAVTQMTNLGFHDVMRRNGVRVVTTDVGDRYVLEALYREGGVLGGEQSGHIVCLDGHVTGDGLAAALLLCRALGGRTVADAVSEMPRYPQASENVAVRRRDLPRELTREVERVNAELGGDGRVVVRPSGTEPVIRVLAEAQTAGQASSLCATIAALVRRELG